MDRLKGAYKEGKQHGVNFTQREVARFMKYRGEIEGRATRELQEIARCNQSMEETTETHLRGASPIDRMAFRMGYWITRVKFSGLIRSLRLRKDVDYQ